MVEFSTQKSADGRDGVDSADGKMVSMMVTSISGEMDGVEQKHFFLAKHHGEMRNRINLPTIKMIKKALVYGTVRTTGKHKHTGCFNYVQEFCRAVSVVAPKYFKMEKSKETVTLNLRKPPALLFGTNSTPNSTGANEKAGNNDKEADVTRHGVKALALSIAPESFYDVVMRAALDKDFRDFNHQGIECRVQSQHLHKNIQKNGSNASFRLKLSPSSAKFVSNVTNEATVSVAAAPGAAASTQRSINIDGMSCNYKVLQYVEAGDENTDIMRKKWQIDVPGFSQVNNLSTGTVKLKSKDKDVKMATGMGFPRVELNTRHLKKEKADGNWTDVTTDASEKAPEFIKDSFFFPVGFSYHKKITVNQTDGSLTFEVKSQTDDSSD